MTIRLTNITFKDDRVQVNVQVDQCLTPEERIRLRELLYGRYPNIKEHVCKNSKGPKFDDCVDTTSIAHVLEHVILEELVLNSANELNEVALLNSAEKTEDLANPTDSLTKGIKTLVAKTSNLGDGLAKIELKYYDDISTLQAINKATSCLDLMLKACKSE